MNRRELGNMRQKTLDDEDIEIETNDQAVVFSEPQLSYVHTAFIDKTIGEPSQYRKLFHILRNAGENDIVKIHINSLGGLLSTGVALMNAIYMCQATTLAIVDFEAVSAATLPVMACDKVIMMPGSYLMIHHAKFGSGMDTVSRVRDQIGFTTKYLDETITGIYEGFLTDDEIHNVIENSKELFFTAEEVEERLENRNKYFEKLENKGDESD